MHLFSLQVCKKWLNLFQKISEADSFRGSSAAEKLKRFLTAAYQHQLIAQDMRLTHRPINQSDVRIVCGFPQSEEEQFFLFPKAAFPLTQVQLQETILKRSDSTIVEADGVVAGFANFYKWEFGGNCSIGNVIVSPSSRGYGVGRYLIECMIETALSKYKARHVCISCFNMNVVGLLLYSKLGFKPCDVEERKDNRGNRVALIHMILHQDRTDPKHPRGSPDAHN
jgi:ribosomal protein S18 acetylase RimI-like enzyme